MNWKVYAKVIRTQQTILACFRQIESNEEKRKHLKLKVRVENVA